MNRFSDIFTYESFERVMSGKIFKGCVLLKCAMYNVIDDDLWETGEYREIVNLTSPASEWIMYFDSKDILPKLSDILNAIQMDPVTPIHVIEDRLGVVITSEDPYLKSVIQFREQFSHKARVIQRAWRNCISNPSYIVCKKRLMREFYSL